MARRDESTEVADGPIPDPVRGEIVETDLVSVQPSVADQNLAADRARGRTAVQVGLPGAVVAIGAWFARLHGLDLDPLPEAENMPPEIVAAFIVVATVVMAFRMNPKTKN